MKKYFNNQVGWSTLVQMLRNPNHNSCTGMLFLSEWSGEMRYLPNIKLKKIKSSDAQPKEEVEQMTEEKEDNALTKEDNSMQADTGDNNSVQEDNAA